MFAHSFKFAALSAAAWLALPFGIAAAQEPDAAQSTEQTEGYSCADGICTAGDEATTTREGSNGKSHCNYGDPDILYVSKDPNQCAATTFICEEGYEHFFNDCGCGCQPIM
jgi:hypothetical protein